MDSDGSMVTGTKNIGGTDYYFDANGVWLVNAPAAGDGTFAASKTELYLEIGQSETIYVSRPTTSCRPSWSADNWGISGKWGDRQSDGSSALTITGERAGTSIVSITNDYNDEQIDVIVTVVPVYGQNILSASTYSVNVKAGESQTVYITILSNEKSHWNAPTSSFDTKWGEWVGEGYKTEELIITGKQSGSGTIKITNDYNDDSITINVTVSSSSAPAPTSGVVGYIVNNGGSISYTDEYGDRYSIGYNEENNSILFTMYPHKPTPDSPNNPCWISTKLSDSSTSSVEAFDDYGIVKAIIRTRSYRYNSSITDRVTKWMAGSGDEVTAGIGDCYYLSDMVADTLMGVQTYILKPAGYSLKNLGWANFE